MWNFLKDMLYEVELAVEESQLVAEEEGQA